MSSSAATWLSLLNTYSGFLPLLYERERIGLRLHFIAKTNAVSTFPVPDQLQNYLGQKAITAQSTYRVLQRYKWRIQTVHAFNEYLFARKCELVLSRR